MKTSIAENGPYRGEGILKRPLNKLTISIGYKNIPVNLGGAPKAIQIVR